VRFVKLLVAAAVGVASLAGAAAPRTASDVPADPAVRSGVLPNGMHYEILRNATPPHNAALRLRIDAGSLSEREDERGIAHFVEHMAMSGTRNFPEGEMMKRLAAAGLRFGPDTNAFTDFRQTYYALNLPETDAATLDTGLTLLRDVAAEATFAPAAIERQRGIILAEERSRANPSARSREEELGFLLKGDLLPQRFPIGLPEIIRTVPRERLVRFYEGHYRPEHATLIAVGDFDPAAMEAKIQALFGTWRPHGRTGASPPPASATPTGGGSHVLVDPALPTQVTLAWLSPPDLRPDSRRVRQERLLGTLGVAILNRRVSRLNAASALVAASAGRASFYRRADAVVLTGIAKPGEWKAGLQRLATQQRAALAQGFGKNEIDGEVATLRTALSVAVSGETTRDSAGLAQLLLASAADERVFNTPEESLAELEAALPELTAERVTAATRALFAGREPLLYVTTPTPIQGGEAAVATAYQEASKAPLPQVISMVVPEQTAKPWPYTDFGAPGRITERRSIDSIGAVAVRFGNGVRLTIKKTPYSKDDILVAARIGRGKLGLTPDEVPAAFALSTGALIQGGVGKLTADEFRQQLAAHHASSSFAITDDTALLAGRTRGADLTLQLQLLAAYLIDPALRSGPWASMRAMAETLHRQLESSPGGVMTSEGIRLLHGGDPRWGFPTTQQLGALGPADGRGLVARMRLDPVELVIVGDVDVEAAIAAAAGTFGALPMRATQTAPQDGMGVRFPAPGLVRAVHKGRPDQALAFVAWPTADFYSDQKRARTLNLLSQIFRQRVLDEIREKMGVSYSPSATHFASEAIPGYGYLAVSLEAPPGKLDDLIASVLRIAADLREHAVAPAELERAKRPVIENYNRERSGNSFWLGRLAGVQTRPEAIAAITEMLPQYESVTPADIHAAARAYLADAKAWKMEIVPDRP
jgi:zinc protease